MKTVVIANPASGRGSPAHKRDHLVDLVKSISPSTRIWWTEGTGHAETLAARARRSRCERVVVCGGDGTLSEVVNGLWWEPHGQLPSIGIVPTGTGCDYTRNFQMADSFNGKCIDAFSEAAFAVDIGVCLMKNDDVTSRRVFLNVLGLGFDAQVAARVQGRSGKKTGRLAYLLSALQELAFLKSLHIRGEIDGEPFESASPLFVAALGRFFGGGMMIAPGASHQRGGFQLIWGESLNRFQMGGLLVRIYSGRHMQHPKVHWRYGKKVRLETEPPVWVEGDGELLGQTPVEVHLHTEAIQIAAGRKPPSVPHC
jgi:YegS/Rv2252/BmrU family lipid kinase